jgi:hypothetical protein
VKRKSPCCASLCATRASAYQQTRYACSFWFAARFAKQSGDVYAESFSPSVLRDVHVHIADNSATDHEFLTTQITSSWGIRRQKRKAAPYIIRVLHRTLDSTRSYPYPQRGDVGRGKCRYANHSSLCLPPAGKGSERLRSTRTTPSALMTSKGSRQWLKKRYFHTRHTFYDNVQRKKPPE